MIRWLLLGVGTVVATWAVMVFLAARLPAGIIKDLAGFLPSCVTTIRRLRRDPRVPRGAKVAVALAGLWVVSPIDLIPEFLPVIGPLDDVVVVALALRYAARRTPVEVLFEAWPGNRSLMERLVGVRRPDETSAALTPPTDRSALRRKRERGSRDRNLLDSILDEALVAHVGYTAEHGPVVLPMTYARIGDSLYLHGAAGNDLLRHGATGVDLCVTVTLLDGLVFARSAFHHSMNYRCAVLFGRAERVTDPVELRAMSAALLDHLALGRSLDARAPTDEELRATLALRLRIEEWSVKVRAGGPIDDADDLRLGVWAGVVPVQSTTGAPMDDLAGATRPDVPGYVAELDGPGPG